MVANGGVYWKKKLYGGCNGVAEKKIKELHLYFQKIHLKTVLKNSKQTSLYFGSNNIE